MDNTPNGTITLTQVGGGTFSLSSIALTEVDTSRLGPTTVSFTGNLAGGGTLNASLALDGVFGFETLDFAGWTNLVSVTWQQTPQFHQFDNISINQVPVPSSLALLGLGLGFLGFRLRRRS